MTRAGLLPVCWLLAAGASAPALAGDEGHPPGPRITLASQSSIEVENDLMRTELAVEAEHKDPAILADQVNRTMAWALKQAGKESAVRVRSGTYQTYAVHEKSRFLYWRARQQLTLESRDVRAMTTLLGRLQERLVVKAMFFTLSPAKRREVEDGLMREAVTAFLARARIASATLAASAYRIVSLNIDSGDLPVRRMAVAYDTARGGLTPPRVASGTSRVTTRVNGTIELEGIAE